ncbi:Gfo/Idh/MocA family protein [Baekduia sp. Peel2402]|uniref:Gfo/Idh/MocA family protein n=1 Tax=Baekduia sp. Peel2402 TaxID=3458296 RepID=UPI00403E71E8
MSVATVAVLGLGSAGRRHAELLEELGVAVVGHDPAVADGGGAASVDDAIAAADAVVVASPSALHAEHAAAALAAGRPVLVEKPVATTVAAARALQPAAGLVAGVAMNWRFHPAVLAARALLAEGALGPILQARVSFGYDLRRWRPETDYRMSYSARADLGGGIVLDAIHELDYLLWLLGPVTSVVAETAHASALELDGVEDTALAVARLASGALATIDLNFHEPVYRRGFLLVGADATAEWAWGTGRVVVRRPDEADQAIAVDEDVRATYRAELADFLDAIATSRPSRATLQDGIAALALAEAIKQSAAEGRRVTLA